MNAAEITDKLGLHSLRQRAWVCLINSPRLVQNLMSSSISNPPVLRPEMVFTRVWSGLQALSGRLVTSRRFWGSFFHINKQNEPPIMSLIKLSPAPQNNSQRPIIPLSSYSRSRFSCLSLTCHISHWCNAILDPGISRSCLTSLAV